MNQKKNSPFRSCYYAAATLPIIFVTGILYLFAPFKVYFQVLKLWGVKAWTTPFLDTDTVLSAVRCTRRGIDVFAANPCDPLHRVYDYSPLWLLLARLPFTERWTAPAGIIVDCAFILSLALLPPPRDRRAAWPMILGILSPATVFALERGNNDLVLFALTALAATLALRAPAIRAIGYGCALLAGLLKYYPMTLMALMLRERPRGFAIMLAAAMAIVGIFLATMGHDLVRALRLIPTGSWYGDMFGASALPGGLTEWFGWPSWTAPALRIALTAASLIGGMTLARNPRFAEAIGRLRPRERSMLLAGALAVLGCFMTAQNIGYRAVLLLLVLPSLTALRMPDRWRWWNAAPAVALALLWSMGWRHWLEQAGTVGDRTGLEKTGWVLREPLWWLMATILIGCAVAILLRAAIVRALLAPTPLRALLPADHDPDLPATGAPAPTT